MTLGANIRRHREARSWTLERLQELSGVDVGTISALENRNSKRSQYAAAIAKALGVGLEELLDEHPSPGVGVSNPEPPPPNRLMEPVTLAYAAPSRYTGRIQVKGLIKTGKDGEFEHLAAPADERPGFVQAAAPHPSSFALKVRGDGLSPTIEDGEFLLIDPTGKGEPGGRVVITLTDGRQLVKKLLFERADTVTVRNVNGGDLATIERATIASMHAVFAIYAADRWRSTPDGD